MSEFNRTVKNPRNQYVTFNGLQLSEMTQNDDDRSCSRMSELCVGSPGGGAEQVIRDL